MSLQVWLPLNGNLNNQGVSNVTYSTPSGISYVNGKFPKCPSISSNTTINYTVPNLESMLANGKTYSLSCWVKPTNNVANGWVVKFGSNNCGLWWANSEARWVWNENDNGKRCANPTISGDYTNWHHLVTTVDKTVTNQITAKHYVDGLPAASYESHTWDNSSQAQPSGNIMYVNPYISLLNDVRLYDHVLSPKEIKELSKGLVAHYPLDNFIGNANLFKLDSVTVDTTTTINGNIITVNAVNQRYSSFNGNRMDFTAGTSYTVSCHIKAESKDSNWAPRITLRNSSNVIQASAILAGSKTEDFLSFTYTPTTTITNGYISGIITGDTAANAKAIFTNVKCEAGSQVTQYIPATTDTLYSIMNYSSNVVQDTSGYGNHATMSSTKPTLAFDSPKYNCCMQFNGSNNFIAVGRGPMVTDAITIAWWGYMDDWTTYQNQRGISCTEAGGWYFGPISGNKIELLVGTGTTSNAYKSVPTSSAITGSGWHMFVGTYDGLSLKIFVDGVLHNTTTAYTTKTPIYYHTSNGIFIGAEAGGNTTTPAGSYFNGKISDVRIYATALSADDVKELYQTSASIANNGSIMALDFTEQ